MQRRKEKKKEKWLTERISSEVTGHALIWILTSLTPSDAEEEIEGATLK